MRGAQKQRPPPGTLPRVPQFESADTTIPLIIVGVCLLLMLITWFFTRSTGGSTSATQGSAAPIVGQTRVTQAQLGVWHREHGGSVKNWIENHETVLQQVSDGGLSIELNGSLAARHRTLGPAIDTAVAKHPAPQMRAQLSALVTASRNTIESLRRSDWSNAEQEHLAYLEYRDTWLDRLRQFSTAETKAASASGAAATTELPSWLDHSDRPAG